MIASVTVAILIMLVSAEAVAGHVNRHQTLKTLTLSFLLLIGLPSCSRASISTCPRATFTYFTVGFSASVEFLNIRRPSPPSGPLATRGAASALLQIGGGDRPLAALRPGAKGDVGPEPCVLPRTLLRVCLTSSGVPCEAVACRYMAARPHE